MKRTYRCQLYGFVGNSAFIRRLDEHEKLGPPEPPVGVLRLGTLTSPIINHDENTGVIETQNSIYAYKQN